MRFRLLGPLEVVDDGDRSLALGGRKQRSVLAVLLLHANDVVATERLVDEVWGDSPPATVAKSIQVYISRMRKELGDGRLVTRPPGYALHVEPSELDLTCFQALVAQAADADPATAAASLREALALWRGPALADLAYEPFAQTHAAQLEELRFSALEQRIDADLAAGEHAQLVGELEALAAQHPLRERLRSIALGAKPMRSPSTRPRARRWSRSSGSSPGARCAICTRRSSARTRGSTSPLPPRRPSGHRPAGCSWAARASSRLSTTPSATLSTAAAASC